jgi:hypothetical protein
MACYWTRRSLLKRRLEVMGMMRRSRRPSGCAGSLKPFDQLLQLVDLSLQMRFVCLQSIDGVLAVGQRLAQSLCDLVFGVYIWTQSGQFSSVVGDISLQLGILNVQRRDYLVRQLFKGDSILKSLFFHELKHRISRKRESLAATSNSLFRLLASWSLARGIFPNQTAEGWLPTNPRHTRNALTSCRWRPGPVPSNAVQGLAGDGGERVSET